MKFQKEAEDLGINMDDKDYLTIMQVYSKRPNDFRCFDIDYDAAIRNIVPVLSRNSDRKQIAKENFTIKWTTSKGTKNKAMIIQK